MATVVAKTAIKREKGWLYYLDKTGDVSRAKMARGGGQGSQGSREGREGRNRPRERLPVLHRQERPRCQGQDEAISRQEDDTEDRR